VELFPAMPLREWADTKETVHRFLQVVGKIRLAASPQRNHWWNVPFHLTGRGVTTRPMGLLDGGPIFTIDFDYVAHRLVVSATDGRTTSFPLYGQSVASFYDATMRALGSIGVRVDIEHPWPFDLPDSGRPFDHDDEHAAYDQAAVLRHWQLLSQVNLVLEEFAQRFSGKVSPVHHFWHTFDIAHTRYGDRHVPQSPETDPVTREAYSREVISFGFWFGDESMTEPAFYSYMAPEPDGLTREPLRPRAARWSGRPGHQLAVLSLGDVRASADRHATVLDFYESTYQAGARLTGWDIAALASPGGVTDPYGKPRTQARLGYGQQPAG
jgi:hypothetical protein